MFKQLVLAAVVLAGFAGTVRAQSLADVAKKEEERRKEIAAPAKVYTNKDLVEVAAPPTPAAPAAAAPDASKDTDKDDAKDDKGPKKDQAYWAGRMKAAQLQLQRDKDFADALQTKINAQTTDFVNRDDPVQKMQIAKDRDKSIAELDRLKKSVVDDQKAIDDLQEEARRAGVPPGWLR
jgi:hypothetical protein